MKTKIEVLFVENRSGRSKKTNNEYSMNICQCVAHVVDADGVSKKLIGELVLPKDHAPVTEGMYEGEFGIQIGQDKRIGGHLVRLTPVGKTATSAAPSAAR